MSKVYQEYRDRVFFKGNTKRDYVKNKVKESIDDLIYNSQYGFKITIGETEHDVAILSTRTTQEYEAANIIAHLGFLDRGVVFNWDNNNWIVLKKMFRPDQPGFNGIAYKCTDSLNWIDSDGVLNTQQAYVRSGRITNALGVTPDKNEYFDNIILHDTDWNMMAATPLNTNLKTEMRFIIKGQSYRISNIDNVSIEGVSILSMVSDKLLDSDDIENKVADVSTYRLDTTVSLPIKLKVGTSLEVPIVVYNEGIIVAEDCNYSGYSDIISMSGNIITAVSAGNTEIQCKLSKNDLVTKTISVEVLSEDVENITKIDLVGNDYILWDSSETYRLSDGRAASFETSTTSKMLVTKSETSNSITLSIKDKYSGKIIVTATDIENNTYIKTVIIKSS